MVVVVVEVLCFGLESAVSVSAALVSAFSVLAVLVSVVVLVSALVSELED